MNDEQQNSVREPDPNAQANYLLVDDIVRYLSRLANLYSEAKTGNSELSDGLRQLVNALRPYSNRPVPDLADIIREATLRRFRETSPKKIKAILPSNLESLPPQEVEKILDDENYTKDQVINLGVKRFGISSAKLTRLGKKNVLESIRAALNHEKSLDVISKEAQRGGEMRSS